MMRLGWHVVLVCAHPYHDEIEKYFVTPYRKHSELKTEALLTTYESIFTRKDSTFYSLPQYFEKI